MKAEHGNTFFEFVFGIISYIYYVEIQFHWRLSISNVKTEEASAGRVTQNTSQVVEGRQRSVSPSGPVVTLLSRDDTLCHRLTRPCDTLVVRTDAITLHASWYWDLETLSSTTDSVQERTLEGAFRSKRRAYVSDSLFEGSSLRMRGSNY